MHHYETAHLEPGQQFLTVTAHHSLETAMEYAESHNIDTIFEIGGNWEEWQKCWFCNNWFPVCELDKEDTCERCQIAIRDHGG